MKNFAKKLKDSLPYSWYYYLLTVILAVALWSAAFTLLHTPKRSESLYLFYAGNVTEASVKNKLCDDLSAYGAEVIHLSSIHPADPAFYAKYDALGLNRCDVLLLPESVAAATDCRETFRTPDEELSAAPFTQEDVPYGFYLPESAKTALSPYFEFSAERYVVLVAAASPNAGGDGQPDTAWRLADRLLTYDEIPQ